MLLEKAKFIGKINEAFLPHVSRERIHSDNAICSYVEQNYINCSHASIENILSIRQLKNKASSVITNDNKNLRHLSSLSIN